MENVMIVIICKIIFIYLMSIIIFTCGMHAGKKYGAELTAFRLPTMDWPFIYYAIALAVLCVGVLAL